MSRCGVRIITGKENLEKTKELFKKIEREFYDKSWTEYEGHEDWFEFVRFKPNAIFLDIVSKHYCNDELLLKICTKYDCELEDYED